MKSLQKNLLKSLIVSIFTMSLLFAVHILTLPCSIVTSILQRITSLFKPSKQAQVKLYMKNLQAKRRSLPEKTCILSEPQSYQSKLLHQASVAQTQTDFTVCKVLQQLSEIKVQTQQTLYSENDSNVAPNENFQITNQTSFDFPTQNSFTQHFTRHFERRPRRMTQGPIKMIESEIHPKQKYMKPTQASSLAEAVDALQAFFDQKKEFSTQTISPKKVNQSIQTHSLIKRASFELQNLLKRFNRSTADKAIQTSPPVKVVTPQSELKIVRFIMLEKKRVFLQSLFRVAIVYSDGRWKMSYFDDNKWVLTFFMPFNLDEYSRERDFTQLQTYSLERPLTEQHYKQWVANILLTTSLDQSSFAFDMMKKVKVF